MMTVIAELMRELSLECSRSKSWESRWRDEAFYEAGMNAAVVWLARTVDIDQADNERQYNAILALKSRFGRLLDGNGKPQRNALNRRHVAHAFDDESIALMPILNGIPLIALCGFVNKMGGCDREDFDAYYAGELCFKDSK